MPQVRRVVEPTVQQSSATPGYQQIGGVSDDAFGASVARSLIKFGQAGQDVADTAFNIQREQWERENTAEVLKADNELGSYENELMNNLYSLKGIDAIEASKTVVKDYEKQAQAVKGTLKSQAQIDAFDRMYSNRRDNVERSVVNYRRTEGLAAANAQADASVEINKQAAIRNRLDPTARDEYLRKAVIATRAAATVQGAPKEVAELAVDRVVSDTHEEIIKALASENPREAMAYYANYKEALTGEGDVRVAKLMETVRTQQQSRDIADEAQGKHPGDVAKQIQYIDEQGRSGKLDADSREKAKAYVQNDYNLLKLADDAQKRETVTNIVKQIDGAKDAGKSWAQIETENVNAMLNISEDDASRLKRYYEYKVEGRNSTTRSEQLAFYNQFLKDLNDPNVVVSQKYTIDQVDLMAPEAFRGDMLKAYAEASSGGKQTSINLVANKSEMDALMDKLGVKGDDQLEMRNAIQRRIEAEVRTRGKDLTPSEVRKLVTDYAVEVKTRPNAKIPFTGISVPFTGETNRVYEITPETDISRVQVPDDARDQIIGEFLKADKNAQPTESEIREVYKAYLLGLQGAR